MGCGQSAPVRVAPLAAEAVTPIDAKVCVVHQHKVAATEHDHVASAAPGPQPAEEAAAPTANTGAEAGTSDVPPAVPFGVGGESAGRIAYHEGEDRLEWGNQSYTAEKLNGLLDACDSGAVCHSLDEWLCLVRQDAQRFSGAYESLRNSAGGPEALEEVAHECAVIRQKVLEDRGDDTGANASFDRGEGNEEEVDNFWNEPFFLLVSAAKVYDKFSEWVASVAKQADAHTAHAVCFKSIASAAQKARRPAWQRATGVPLPSADDMGAAGVAGQGRGWGSVLDIVRASLVVDDWDGVLRCLQAVRGDFDVEILRIRNRFTATADVPQVWGGYRHIALTIRLLGHGHVCELLIHHRQLYSLRSPEADVRFHKFRDALAFSQNGDQGVETFTQLLSPRGAE